MHSKGVHSTNCTPYVNKQTHQLAISKFLWDLEIIHEYFVICDIEIIGIKLKYSKESNKGELLQFRLVFGLLYLSAKL